MTDSKLQNLSMAFAVEIISLVKDLKTKHETIISSQIGRSGTSIGANIYEANYAQGRKDFVSKLEIALKEASETGYWIELLFKTNYINEDIFKKLNDQCSSIRVMLISSCRTAKSKSSL
ncbi:MAG: four helix bundle protein [Christensenellales bacterium]